MKNKKPDKKEIENKLNLVIDKLMNLGKPDNDEELEKWLSEWIISVRKSFSNFVPKRIESQINQWVSLYLFQIVGYVTDELIRRGVLKKPLPNKPFTDGVFYVSGKYINP